MKLILIEGQPGSGKSTISDYIYRYYINKNENCILLDEYIQDTQIFGDYWDSFNVSYEYLIDKFTENWDKILKQYNQNSVVVIDNGLLNQVQYLMAIETPYEKIKEFFCGIIELFMINNTNLLFMDGDSNVVISRIDKIRKNGWGERVGNLLEDAPYQKSRYRVGLNGMIEFFSDAQELKRELLNHWKYNLLRIDVTDGEWSLYEKEVNDFIKHL